ncbi:HlyD family secretion protein [Symmachiella dynata]|uniref:HlyD family secretion protein n=1 Tax=Symmachiella dynata TaxID=2527995 RepID=A0A517ZXL0_9PLAN|nr:HlyD family efflux transporter periplasmic adaptor subunit [Symmachiella dynata]QDU47217.1 HlyD family secretion protein [Symmachiella dynata]
MSTTETAGTSQIEKTKQQIRRLVSEIARLSETDVSDEEYFPNYLGRILAALAAPAGAVWLRNDAGALELVYQINLQEVGFDQLGEAGQQTHGRLLGQILTNNRGAAIPAKSGGTEPGSPGNPTDYLIVASPLTVDGTAEGLVEVFHNPSAAPVVQQGYERFLNQVCELGAGFLKNRRLRGLVDRQHLWSRLESFTRQVHTSLKTNAVAYTVANDGRRLIGCDRVSVALRHGKKMRIEAISGQDVVDRRANLTQLMSALVDSVVFAGEPLVYTGSTDDLPPRIEEALRDYVDEGSSKAVFVMPLKETQDDPEAESRYFGALVVEQIEDNQPEPQLRELAEIVVRHSETALYNSQRYQRVFLLPVWQWMGSQVSKLKGRGLAKFLAVLMLLAGIIGVLTLVPGEFRLEGDGKLQPRIRRDLFASEAGTVRNIRVDHGDRVHPGDVLVEMEDLNLESQLQKAQIELHRAESEYNIKRNQRNAEGISEQEKIQITGDLMSLDANRESLKADVESLQQRKRNLNIISPIEGVVTTWGIEERIANRPVQPGTLLVSVADDQKSWVLEVKVPEDRVGHILRAQQELKPGEQLDVTYVLATNPERRYHGKVEKTAMITEVVEEEGNVVLLTITPDPEDMPEKLRPGAEVKAGIICGERPLGYVYFHPAIDAFYYNVKFWLGY